MAERHAKLFGWTLLCGLAALVAWYIYASDYSYRAISGMYILKQGASRYTLKLNADRTFTEDAMSPQGQQHAAGTWRRLGEGGVALEGMYPLPLGVERGSDGTVFAEANKSYTVRPSLDFTNGRVRFYKGIF